MDNQKKNSNKRVMILGIILLVLLFIAGFLLIGGSDEESATTLTSPKGSEISVLEADALVLISKIESLSLESDLFESPAFVGLVDISKRVTNEPEGRENPFAPIR